MNNSVAFETPENIHVAYRTAGVGTRFVAWFVDQMILTIFCIFFFFAAMIAGAALGLSLDGWFESLDPDNPVQSMQQVQLIMLGVSIFIWSLGSFFYFGLSELFMRGQTIGKRQMNIRVVKADGFALDPMGVFIRTIFRVVDQLPLLWIVPVVAPRQQRFGDMAARTIVVAEEAAQISPLRETLAKHTAAESRFRFDATMLKKCRPEDYDAVEQLLERWHGLDESMRETVAGKISTAMATRMGCDPPPRTERRDFLIDLLAAEFRRQSRALG
jgi:uncharacterized RDD family membrane protein YckC